jgi:hypothetical protein
VPIETVTVREVEQGPYFEVFRGSGAMRIDWTRKGALRVIMAGHGDAGYSPLAVRRWDTQLKAGRFVLLADFWDMQTYDSQVRVGWTGWCTKHRADLDGLHILLRSKLVAMGVTVANLALGGLITVHTERTKFDALAKTFGFPLNPQLPLGGLEPR